MRRETPFEEKTSQSRKRYLAKKAMYSSPAMKSQTESVIFFQTQTSMSRTQIQPP